MDFRKIIFIFSLLLIPLIPFCQNNFPVPGEVFTDEVVPRIDILIDPDSLDALYAPGNEESNYHFKALFMFDNGYIRDTLENIGFRFRGNTSRHSSKKSFKISFNTYEPGRQWYGLEKLNINGEHNDPTITRAILAWDLCQQIGIPAPRANHVDLYINGDFWGVYANVEHIDEEFVELRFGNKDGNLYKCLYPADLNYKGANPDLYKEVFWGRRAYALKTNADEDNYEDIAELIDVLNNTPISELACELDRVFNIDTYLKAIALDILTANWDGPIYNKNNFYLYNNQETGKFEYIPYDLDNTFGIDWFGIDWQYRDIYDWGHPNEDRPIYSRILQVPKFKRRYSHYLNQIIQTIYKTDELNTYLDEKRDLIAPSAELDPLRPLDYGFSFDDFINSFEMGLSPNHVKTGIKDFINERRFSAFQQIDFQNIEPIITGVQNNHPNQFQEIYIGATVKDNIAVSKVEVCYYTNGQGPNCFEMQDDGLNNDGMANDENYGIILPPLNQAGTISYYISATDNSGLDSQNPICSTYQINIGSSSVPLVINEFMAKNDEIYADEFGEFDDWLEIFNASDVPTYLGNYFLSDNQNIPDKWQMPDIWIQPEEYLIFWADKDEDQGVFHTNFKLSSDGEFIGIFDSQVNNFAIIDSYEFGEVDADEAIGRIPNSTGPFQRVFPTPGAFNEPTSTVEKDLIEIIDLRLSPNPFKGFLEIYVENPYQRKLRVMVTNLLGQAIFAEPETSNPINLKYSTTNLNSGLYIVSIIENELPLASKKVILVK